MSGTEDDVFSASRATQEANSAPIVDAFISGSFKAEWTSSVTKKAYVVRGCRNDAVDYDDSRTAWPFAFINEEWVVTGVMVDVTTTSPRLVGLWGYSVRGDETNQFYLDSDKEDAWLFAQSHEDRIDGEWNNAFSVSSGDDAVDNDDFQCPVFSSQTVLEKLVAAA
jgi:hypothetical protein